MNRRTIVSFVCAAIALVLSAPAGFAQQTAQLPKLNPFRTPTKDPSTAAGASLKAALESGRAKAGVNAKLIALTGVTHYETARFRDPLRQAVPWLREVWK